MHENTERSTALHPLFLHLAHAGTANFQPNLFSHLAAGIGQLRLQR
ncbi:hypothetical protein [Polaromonas hydrogenivorans]|uniref:Uncharacterized protein n=1 Tax=Polaromonas hydrogenivorans TaxID=335476 RepID=A0AAU7LWA9_9BURK